MDMKYTCICGTPAGNIGSFELSSDSSDTAKAVYHAARFICTPRIRRRSFDKRKGVPVKIDITASTGDINWPVGRHIRTKTM